MTFRQQYAKAEKKASHSNRTTFARCTPSFWIRTKNDDRYLMLRVRCSGAQNDRSLGIKVIPGQFNHETDELAGDPETTIRLADLKASILKVFTEREITGRSLEPKIIVDIAFGLRGHDDTLLTIFEVIQHWLNQKEKTLGNDFVLSSFNQYRRYSNMIREFVTLYYGKGAKLDVLKPAIKHELLGYIKGERKLSHNYAVKIIQFLKAILDYALAHEWCDRNVLAGVKMNKQKKEVHTLDMADLDKLQQTDFAEDMLNEVKDVFLFCCYSGLAYIDVKTLTPDHIITVEGIQCVLKNRQKSGQQSFVPLFPEAIALLNKYSTHRICRLQGVCMPVLSNVKMNKWLKVIGNVAQIKESLHTHLARKTFTMYAEERGFKLEQTAIMMGHSHSSMTSQYYYKQRRETVIKAFKDIQLTNSQELN